ncbi:MAG: hypothetical protein O9289_07520 [Rhodobacteraceae bacterium]|nr:hypothetical protein [Paracoccaceae bacterium]MCZ8083041.1 hypothetical protein [Paracoccaceae bacterium]
MAIEKKKRSRAYLPPTPIFENIVGLATTTIERLIAENSGLEISEFNYFQIEYKRIVHEIQCNAARQLFYAIGEWYEKDSDLVEIDAIQIDQEGKPVTKKRGQARENSLNPDFVQRQAKERTREMNAWINHCMINESKLYFITMNVNSKRLCWGFEYKKENARRWEKMSEFVKWCAQELGVYVEIATLEQTFKDTDLSLYPHFHYIAYIPEPEVAVGRIREKMCLKWRELIGNDTAYLKISGNVKSSIRSAMYILKPSDLTAIANHDQGVACFSWLFDGMKRSRNYARYNHFREFSSRLKREGVTTCGSIVEPKLRKKQADEYHARKPKEKSLSAARPISQTQNSDGDPVKTEEVKVLPKGKNTIVATIAPRPVMKHCVAALIINNYDPFAKGGESQRKFADIQMKLNQQREAFVRNIGGEHELKVAMAKRDAMREIAQLFIEKGITPPKDKNEWLASSYCSDYHNRVSELTDHYKKFYEPDERENIEKTENAQNMVDNNPRKTPPENDFKEGMVDFLSIFE